MVGQRPDSVLGTYMEASISKSHLTGSSGKANSVMKKPCEGNRKEGRGPTSSEVQSRAPGPIPVPSPGSVDCRQPSGFPVHCLCPRTVKIN